jgi:hypothetical protein
MGEAFGGSGAFTRAVVHCLDGFAHVGHAGCHVQPIFHTGMVLFDVRAEGRKKK